MRWQSPPLPTNPVGRRAAVPAPRRALPARPAGLGRLAGWETEVALPVVGTFTAPGKGSLRADAVLQAPEDGVPVLFVEVDNHTEPAATVAAKISRYRRFFQRKVKDHGAGMWSCGRRCGRTPGERRLPAARPGVHQGRRTRGTLQPHEEGGRALP
ncbi:replication-relaxation family protein [Streptomyces sp. NPDC021218]|uniref:replication-relaxation family protein n=1 Tax=unclassified Streptomyces TaxID=2593676 RepID=UPI0036C14ADD